MAFESAVLLFTSAQALRPDDQAVTLHLDRAQTYLHTPPPIDWNGVHVMKTK